MAIQLQVSGYLGKEPESRIINDRAVIVLSIASRRPNSRHADWITGTIYEPSLQLFATKFLHTGSSVVLFGIMSKLSVYFSQGKHKPGLDMLVNAIAPRQTRKGEAEDVNS